MIKKWKQFNESELKEPRDREFNKSEKFIKLEEEILDTFHYNDEKDLKKAITKLKKEFKKREKAEKGTTEYLEAQEIRGWLHQLRSKLLKISGDISHNENNSNKLIEKWLNALLSTKINSLIISGFPGDGKVNKITEFLNRFDKKYEVINSRNLATDELLSILYRNKDNLIVFDGCEYIIKNNINILRNALNRTQIEEGSFENFIFNGQIIFIGNYLSKKDIHNSILSRSIFMEYSINENHTEEENHLLWDLKNRPFMLFAGDIMYPEHPSEELIGMFKSQDEAEGHLQAMLETGEKWEWAEILNLNTGRFITGYDHRDYKSD